PWRWASHPPRQRASPARPPLPARPCSFRFRQRDQQPQTPPLWRISPWLIPSYLRQRQPCVRSRFTSLFYTNFDEVDASSIDRFQYVLRLHLPVAAALFLALPLTNTCSNRGPQIFSLPQQSAGAPLQEPVESSNGNGALASPLPAGKGSSSDVHKDNKTPRGNDSIVHSDLVHSDLYNAVANGHTEVVETLIAEMREEKHLDSYYGWDMNTIGVEDGKDNTLLHVAAANGYAEIAKLLLQAEASVTARNNDQDQVGDTPLHDAALQGQLEAA
ncbi:MAG: ankyrin repeat domain-containing protein, partial [Synechococcus sp. SB0669_bin_7]|nr:ankyrin repeat domain-containing protein [Synechococcus sp. SB0669_bin_7]